MGIVKRLFLGRNDGEGAELYELNDTGQDGGEDYNGYALSDRVSPAGMGGEAAFYALYIPVTFEADETPLRVKVRIDDVEVVDKLFTLANPDDPDRVKTVLEVGLMVQLPDTIVGHEELGQWAPRGTWIQVELATEFTGGVSFVQIDGVELEHEIVVEGKREGPNP